MGKIVPWDSPTRKHGAAKSDFKKIAANVRSRNLPKPGSSGNWQITILKPSKRAVYVGKRRRAIDHPPGKPWYIEWLKPTPKSLPRNKRMKRRFFADPYDVIQWLQTHGY